MMTTSGRITGMIFGGLFIGAWLYVAMFIPEVNWPAWVGWGFLGLVFAGALYAGRIANETWRWVIYGITGVGLGLLVMALWHSLIDQGNADVAATLLTFAGGALVVSSLPVPGETVDGWREVPVDEARQ